MGFGAWGNVLDWITKRIDQVSKFFKKSKRRKHVQKFDKAVDNHNTRGVNDRLSKLKKKCKNRDDSR